MPRPAGSRAAAGSEHLMRSATHWHVDAFVHPGTLWRRSRSSGTRQTSLREQYSQPRGATQLTECERSRQRRHRPSPRRCAHRGAAVLSCPVNGAPESESPVHVHITSLFSPPAPSTRYPDTDSDTGRSMYGQALPRWPLVRAMVSVSGAVLAESVLSAVVVIAGGGRGEQLRL